MTGFDALTEAKRLLHERRRQAQGRLDAGGAAAQGAMTDSLAQARQWLDELRQSQAADATRRYGADKRAEAAMYGDDRRLEGKKYDVDAGSGVRESRIRANDALAGERQKSGQLSDEKQFTEQSRQEANHARAEMYGRQHTGKPKASGTTIARRSGPSTPATIDRSGETAGERKASRGDVTLDAATRYLTNIKNQDADLTPDEELTLLAEELKSSDPLFSGQPLGQIKQQIRSRVAEAHRMAATGGAAPPSAGEAKEIASVKRAAEAFKNIASKKPSVDTGPIANLIIGIKRKLGAPVPRGDLTLRLQQATEVLQVLHENAGSAMTNGEIARIMETMPSFADNDETFTANLSAAYDLIIDALRASKDRLAMQGKSTQFVDDALAELPSGDMIHSMAEGKTPGQPAGAGRVRVTNGIETFDIDAGDLAEAVGEGFWVVYE